MRNRQEKPKKAPWLLAALLVITLGTDMALGLWLRGTGKVPETEPLMAAPLLWLRDPGKSATAQPKPTPSAPAETAPEQEQAHHPTSLSETTLPTEVPTEPSGTTAPLAVYGQDEYYFDDALFIGDSRLDASAQYARLGEADYFTGVGMTVFRLFSEQCYDDNFSATDLETLLTERSYGKIYIMLGLNEAGYALDSLLDAYAADLAEIRELQPDAKIFLLKIYGVSREQADSADWLGPQNLNRINEGIAGLCDGKHVICLDPREIYEDSAGYLREDCSGDGIHPYVKDLGAMNAWLCENAQ